MIRLGLIGLGERWDDEYAPALGRFANRVEVVALFDPIAARARAVADELGVAWCDGIRATGAVANVDALLVLDVGPAGLAGVRLAASGGKPLLVLGPTGGTDADWGQLAREADERGQLLVPALAHRYGPATARLRELVATSVGRAREITVHADRSAGASLGHLFDWCGYVGQSPPTSVTVEPLNGHVPTDLDGCRIRLEFEGTGRMTANVDVGSAEPSHAIVGCERGHVRVDFPHTVTWRSPRDESRVEDLSDERPEFDVMLDQFLRRVVGGLVPVPNLDDVRRVHRIEAAARESLRSGEVVGLE